MRTKFDSVLTKSGLDAAAASDWLDQAPDPDQAPAIESRELVRPAPAYTPTDSLFGSQWHLLNTGQSGGTAGIDINVTAVWNDYNGHGVVVGVYDDGVQYTHPDLDGNYDASRHLTINGVYNDPMPVQSSDSHGTAVAGLIAAENDGTGTVGVAFGATLVGVEAFDISYDDLDAAMNQQDAFDIVNHSWGWWTPFVDSQLDSQWSLFYNGLVDATTNGRGGRGTIMVEAAGNDREATSDSQIIYGGLDANTSNLTNSRFMIAVGAVDNTGTVSYYSTPGANVLIAAPSNGGTLGISTTDRTGKAGYNSGSYDSTFGGTSAAAPMVSGIVALMLQANANLGWRDVQDILAYSARHVGTPIGSSPTHDEIYPWSFNAARDWNGGGLHFSNDYGFGLVDALAAVRLSETWTVTSTSANETHLTAFNGTQQAIPDANATGITYAFNIGSNIDVEHIAVNIDMATAHTRSGDLVITLTSPNGTVSTLLNHLGLDQHGTYDTQTGATDFDDWVLTSNAFRGEASAGTWTLRIVDAPGYATQVGTVRDVTLDLYGSSSITNDVYVYTNEYATYANQFGHSTTLADTDGGTDTLNASAVSANSTINLNASAISTIAGTSLTIAAGTMIENAYGGDGNDTITGNSAGNLLSGGRGNDRLDGGTGADTLTGGPGNDTFVYSASYGADIVTDFIAGASIGDVIDLLGMSIVHSLDDIIARAAQVAANLVITFGGGDTLTLLNVTLGSLNSNDFLFANGSTEIVGDGNNNNLVGTSADDVIRGLGGNDTLDGLTGADTMYGGPGDDTYQVDNAGDAVVELSGEGYDTVFSAISYTLPVNVESLYLVGGAGLTGTGNALDNYLVSNGNASTLIGGAGNDAYEVHNSAVQVVENAGEGYDTVYADVSFTLPANVEALVLLGSGSITGTGNSLSNAIYGNNGASTLAGGGGDDFYFVHNAASQVVENANGGYDTVYADVSFTLGANVEQLVLYGPGNINATGNGGDNCLYGNGATNTLAGGAGNDFYYVHNAASQVVENASEGYDSVFSDVSFTLGANIEQLILYGSGNIDGTGNAGDNFLYGNGGVNTLRGGAGNDFYYVYNAASQAIENANEGYDTVYANVSFTLGANIEQLILYGPGNINGTGNALDNFLYGNGGVNTLAGGAGNDFYYVYNSASQAIENANEGYDTVYANVSFALGANVEQLVLYGAGNLTGTGNALDNFIIANNSGTATLAGGAGNDFYYVNGASQVTEAANEGYDTVYSTVSFTLGANVEQLVFHGSGNLTGVGNGLNNVFVSNGHDSAFTGGGGSDQFNFSTAGGHSTITDFGAGNATQGLSGIRFT